MNNRQRYAIVSIAVILFSTSAFINTATAIDKEFAWTTVPATPGPWDNDDSWDPLGLGIPTSSDNVLIDIGDSAGKAYIYDYDAVANHVTVDIASILELKYEGSLACESITLTSTRELLGGHGGSLQSHTDCPITVTDDISVAPATNTFGSVFASGNISCSGLIIGNGGSGDVSATAELDVSTGTISVGSNGGTANLSSSGSLYFSTMNIGASDGTGQVSQSGSALGTIISIGPGTSNSTNGYSLSSGSLNTHTLIVGNGYNGSNLFSRTGGTLDVVTMVINNTGTASVGSWTTDTDIAVLSGALSAYNLTINSGDSDHGEILCRFYGTIHTNDFVLGNGLYAKMEQDNYGQVTVDASLYMSTYGPDFTPTYTLNCTDDIIVDLSIDNDEQIVENNMYIGYLTNSLGWFDHLSGQVEVDETIYVGYNGTGLYHFTSGDITADTIAVGTSTGKGAFLWNAANGNINANITIGANGVLALGENHSLPYNYNNLDVGSGNAITMNAAAGIGVGNDATATYSGSYTLDKDFYALDGGILSVTGDLTIDDGLTLELDDGKVECEAFILGETGLSPDDGTLNITANGGEITCSEGVTLNPSAIITADADYTVRICLDDNEAGYFDNLVENPATGDPALDFEHLELICEYDASNVAGTDHSTLTLECAGDPTDPWDVFGTAAEDNNFVINHLIIGRDIPSATSGSITLELVNNNDNNNGGDGRVVDGPSNEAVYVRMLEILPGADIDCGGTYTDANDAVYAVYPLYYARIPGETTDNFRLLIPGDCNLDGTVNLDDHIILMQNYGSSGTSWGTGDFNGDRVTNIDDFIIMQQHYGESTPEE